MYESSALWTFTAPDGTSISLNDSSGVLICEDVTGNDSPNVRESMFDLPEQDGAVAGSFFYSSRPMTWTGYLGGTPAVRNQTATQLQAALRGLRGDVVFSSQASGLPAMQASGRIQNLRITKRDGIAKSFQFAIICADPRFYSVAVSTQSGTGSVSFAGAAFPFVFPINFGGGTGATVTVNVTNAGNFDSYPVVTITGPIDNPWVRNATTGLSLYLDNFSLAAGEYVVIDMAMRTVTKNDGTSQYGKMRFPGSDWLLITVGTSTLELRSGGATSSATLRVDWRDAWL